MKGRDASLGTGRGYRGPVGNRIAAALVPMQGSDKALVLSSGRCVTTLPPTEMFDLGIKVVYLGLKAANALVDVVKLSMQDQSSPASEALGNGHTQSP